MADRGDRQDCRRRLPPEGDERRYCFVTRPRCTACGSASLRLDHTVRNEAGEVENQHATCRTCGGRCIICWE